MNLRKIFHRQIYGITCFEKSLGRGNLYVVKKMLESGIRIIQYREKYRNSREKLAECLHIRELTKKYGAVFIVNDSPALAVLSGADGLHLGQEDLPVFAARKLIKKNMFIGVSTHSPAQAKKAAAEGADYIGVGPVFKTDTKENPCKPVGIKYVRYAAKNAAVPFVAIGGIKEHKLDEVLEAGAYCVCLVSEITAARDIKRKVSGIFAHLIKHDSHSAARWRGGAVRGRG